MIISLLSRDQVAEFRHRRLLELEVEEREQKKQNKCALYWPITHEGNHLMLLNY